MAFKVYDCNYGSAPIEQYLLLDPEPCGDMQNVHAIKRSSWRDLADQEGATSLIHQVHRVPDDHVNVLRLPEQSLSAKVSEVQASAHNGAT